MIAYHVTIPDTKQYFFQEFLEIIGANYEKKESESFILSFEQKKILDEQEHLNPSDFQDADEFLSELKKKYGL